MDLEENGKTGAQEISGHTEDGRMGLVDHLDELRRRLIYCIVFVMLGSIAGWFIVPGALDLLTSETGPLQYLGPIDAFAWRMRLALIFGFVIVSPLTIVQIWLFIRPGLHPHERRFAFPTVMSAIILFFLGSGLGVYTIPLTLRILEKFGGPAMRANYTIDRFIGFVGMLIIGLGLVFEMPVVLVLLAKLGIVSYERLVSARKFAIVTTVVVAAIITPTSDPVTLMVFAVPLYMLYEITLLIVRFMKKKPNAETTA